jgi:hypothetical protein
MADPSARLTQLKEFEVTPHKVLLNQRTCSIMPLPLAVSLKRALVVSGAEGHIPREHARRLLALLGLWEV